MNENWSRSVKTMSQICPPSLESMRQPIINPWKSGVKTYLLAVKFLWQINRLTFRALKVDPYVFRVPKTLQKRHKFVHQLPGPCRIREKIRLGFVEKPISLLLNFREKMIGWVWRIKNWKISTSIQEHKFRTNDYSITDLSISGQISWKKYSLQFRNNYSPIMTTFLTARICRWLPTLQISFRPWHFW